MDNINFIENSERDTSHIVTFSKFSGTSSKNDTPDETPYVSLRQEIALDKVSNIFSYEEPSNFKELSRHLENDLKKVRNYSYGRNSVITSENQENYTYDLDNLNIKDEREPFTDGSSNLNK